MSIARVRVEVQRKYGDPMKNVKDALYELRRRVEDAGILTSLKEHEVFESKTQKKRRKKKAARAKFQREQLEARILAGEKVRASAGVVKKIMASIYKKKKSKNHRKDKKDGAEHKSNWRH